MGKTCIRSQHWKKIIRARKHGIFRDSFKTKNRMLGLYPNELSITGLPQPQAREVSIRTMSFCLMYHRDRIFLMGT
jgi:hypothetical protein